MFIPPDPHFFGYVVGHEGHITRLIAEIVAEGDTCVDVGANIGYFSVMMAGKCGQSGRVYAYEPEPTNVRALAENVKIAQDQGRQIILTAAAVSQGAGTVELIRGEESTLHQVRSATEVSGPAELVPSVNLAEDLASKGASGPIKLLKIDVEGHEAAVLKGCAELFDRRMVQAAVVEVTAGEQAREISTLLQSFAHVPSNAGSMAAGVPSRSPTFPCEPILWSVSIKPTAGEDREIPPAILRRQGDTACAHRVE